MCIRDRQRSTAFHVWCVLGDGSAVCMTLNREQNVAAWHAHRLEHGLSLIHILNGTTGEIEDHPAAQAVKPPSVM